MSGDTLGDGVAAGDRERSSLAEGGLDVDDDEGPASAGTRAGVMLVAHGPTIAGSAARGDRDDRPDRGCSGGCVAQLQGGAVDLVGAQAGLAGRLGRSRFETHAGLGQLYRPARGLLRTGEGGFSAGDDEDHLS